LRCNPGKFIALYSIKRENGRYYSLQGLLPYVKKIEHLNLDFLKSEVVDLLPIETLSYYEKTWYIGGKPLVDNAVVIAVSCIGENGRKTSLSDPLYLFKSNWLKP